MSNGAGVDLADIVSPAMPAATGWSSVAAIATLIAVLIGAAVAVYWVRSRRLAAHRRLKRLQRALHRQSIDPRAAVYSTAATVGRGLGLTRLTASTPLPSVYRRRDDNSKHRWRAFAASLAAQRYGPTSPGRDAALDTVREARRWLRPWC